MQEGTFFFALEGPLSAAPSDWQTRAAHLQGFSRLVRDLGGEPECILERHDIDPKSLRHPDSYVDCLSLLGTIEYCSTALNQPLFGLLLARLQSSYTLGSVVPLCKAAPDIRTALTSLCAYLPSAHCPQCYLELIEGERISELKFGGWSDSDAQQQMTYGAMFTLTTFMRELCNDVFSPAYISTCFSPSSREVEMLESVLACRIYTRAQRNAIAFNNEILAKPLRSADRVIFRLVGDYFAKIKAERERSLVRRVEDYIRGALPSGPTLARCATALGLAARELQIKLDEHGATFTDLLSKNRIGLAQTHLAREDLTLDEIALRLGYSDQTSFGRAFRRWTGSTPGEFRLGRRLINGIPN